MNIIPRKDWGAAAAKYRRTLSTTHNGWFWHWLGVGFPEQMSDAQILQSIQRYHTETKKWSDVAYSFAVGRELDAKGEAKAYELRGDLIAGGHTQGYNNSSMAIVFLIGEGETPTPEMFRTAYKIMQLHPEMSGPRSHRDVGTTQCPGDEIASEVNNPQYLKDTTMTPTEAEAIVTSLYEDLLGREADAGGLAFWVDRLVNGVPVDSVRWNFVTVRLAADDARIKALAAKQSSSVSGGPDANAVAEQAYRLFLDDLVGLGA